MLAPRSYTPKPVLGPPDVEDARVARSQTGFKRQGDQSYRDRLLQSCRPAPRTLTRSNIATSR